MLFGELNIHHLSIHGFDAHRKQRAFRVVRHKLHHRGGLLLVLFIVESNQNVQIAFRVDAVMLRDRDELVRFGLDFVALHIRGIHNGIARELGHLFKTREARLRVCEHFLFRRRRVFALDVLGNFTDDLPYGFRLCRVVVVRVFHNRIQHRHHFSDRNLRFRLGRAALYRFGERKTSQCHRQNYQYAQ